MPRKNFNNLLTKLPPDRRARVEKGARQIVLEMALRDLRRSLNITQEQLATALEINQGSVSKVEGQADMYVSTLHRPIEALGGKLQLVPHFPDKQVIINQFDEPT